MPTKKKKRTSLSMRLNDVMINYVHLIKPGTDLDGAPKYMLFATFPEDHPQVDDILSIVETVAETNGLDIDDDNFKHPLRSAKGSQDFESFSPSKQLEVGFLGINCKAPFDEDRENNGQPVLVDAKRNFITSSTEIYSGCTANLSLSFYPFSQTAEGVAVGLRGVQVTERGERLDGFVSDPDELFDEVDGFTSSKGFEQSDDSGDELEENSPEIETPPTKRRGRPKGSKNTTKATSRRRKADSDGEEEKTTSKRRTRSTTKSSTERRTTEVPDIFDEDDLI